MKGNEPAFPTVDSRDGGNPNAQGISVRDYIAIKAMQGMVNFADGDAKTLAKASYLVADAMIAESQKETK